MKLPKAVMPVLCTVLLLCCNAIRAQLPVKAEGLEQSRLVTRATMYGIGVTNVFDTYLSPQEYTGIDFRVSRESMRMTRWMDSKLSLQSFFQADLGYTHNKVDNNNTFSALANWNYGLHYNFPVTSNFKLLAGGLADLNGGLSTTCVIPTIRHRHALTSIWTHRVWPFGLTHQNYPLTLRYQVNLPLMGVMFSPHYGQSYYEIFSLGNSSGVVKFTSLHNQPSLRQMLTADFPIGRAKMRFAYIWDAQQSKVNDIKTHTYSHVFMVGFVKELYLLKNKKKR